MYQEIVTIDTRVDCHEEGGQEVKGNDQCAVTYSTYRHLPMVILYASIQDTAPNSCSAGWRIQGRVSFVEHDAVDSSVLKNPTSYARSSAKLMPPYSASVWTKLRVALMADRHRAHCVSLIHRVTPPHVEFTPADVVVVVVWLMEVDVGQGSVVVKV